MVIGTEIRERGSKVRGLEWPSVPGPPRLVTTAHKGTPFSGIADTLYIASFLAWSLQVLGDTKWVIFVYQSRLGCSHFPNLGANLPCSLLLR